MFSKVLNIWVQFTDQVLSSLNFDTIAKFLQVSKQEIKSVKIIIEKVDLESSELDFFLWTLFISSNKVITAQKVLGLV